MEGMFNPLSILLHVVNAAILIVALYFLLYKPVRRYMSKRSEGVARELQDVSMRRRSSGRSSKKRRKRSKPPGNRPRTS